MGKQSRQKLARRELDAAFAKLGPMRQAALDAIQSAGVTPAYPPLAIAPAEAMAVTAFEQVIAAGAKLTAKSKPSEWAAFAKEAGDIFDHMAELAYRAQDFSFDAMPDCKPGCSWCCHLRVTISLDEGLSAVSGLQSLAPETQTAVRSRLTAHVAETGTLSTTDILRKPRLCPLNEAGNCMVYENRPLVCRVAHNYNVRSCRGYVESGSNAGGKKSAVVQEIGRFVAIGMRQTRERLGFEDRTFELSDLLVQIPSSHELPQKASLDSAHRADVEAAAIMDARRAQAGFA